MKNIVNVHFDHTNGEWVIGDATSYRRMQFTSPTVLMAVARFYITGLDKPYIQGVHLNNYDDAPLPGMDLEFVKWREYEITNLLGEKEKLLSRWESTQTGVVEARQTYTYVRLTTKNFKPVISVYNTNAIVTPREWDEDAEFYTECCKYVHNTHSITHYLEKGKVGKAGTLINDQYSHIVECLVNTKNAAKAQKYFREVIMPFKKEWSEKLKKKIDAKNYANAR